MGRYASKPYMRKAQPSHLKFTNKLSSRASTGAQFQDEIRRAWKLDGVAGFRRVVGEKLFNTLALPKAQETRIPPRNRSHPPFLASPLLSTLLTIGQLQTYTFDRVSLLLPFPRDPRRSTHVRDAPLTRHALKLGAAQGEASRWLHLPPLPLVNVKLL